MRGGLQPHDRVRDERPREDWYWALGLVLLVVALWAGLR